MKQGWLVLFLDQDKVLNLVEMTLMVLVTQNIIFLSKLGDIAYKIYVISRYLVFGTYMKVIHYVGLQSQKK